MHLSIEVNNRPLKKKLFVGIDSMAVVNRCQGFYRLRIYHLTTGAICAPPLNNTGGTGLSSPSDHSFINSH